MDINPAKLFVGNLPWSARESELEQLFAEHGEIAEVVVLTDKYTHRSKGFGFVTFENAEDAAKAVEALNDYELDGRKLVVNVAQPKTEGDRPRRDFNNRGGFGGGHRSANRGSFGGGHRSAYRDAA